ncbi:NAD-dependent epimerase/dehydratase family protein [Actinomadura viridis]|uniref:NAD-dependent epimerase/dehydratase family protein n=1 Tax=Actinomadura viridis TaxID=58110 RepID=UPI0036821BA7
MRALVIGGTGFVGRRIVADVVRDGGDALLVHRGGTEPEGLPDCEHLHVDRSELGGAAAAIRAFRPDAVIDTYALSRADAEAVVPHLPDVPRVVLSSMDVYRAYDWFREGREGGPVPIGEDAPLRTSRFPYRGSGQGLDDYEKLDVEEVYLKNGGTVLRLGVVFGEHDWQRREEFVLRRVRAGRDRIPVGAGDWLWSRCHVGDVATAALTAARARTGAGEVYNIAEPRTWTMLGWARRILDAAGHRADLVRVPDEVLPDDLALTRSQPQHMLMDVSKAAGELGWAPADPLRAVAESVRWHLDNPPEDAGTADLTADDRALAAADAASPSDLPPEERSA